ncbi:VOC family protein [Parapedobacter sp. 2B3]|uniref:VOC family protein n=1 Tax=Parapedobacter sp. 2B3 TaxID=3342381 RepID=UPI0035B69A52
MSQNPNAICWFEIYVDDMERAKTFYSAVLGITFQDMAVPGGANDFKMSSFPADPDPEKMGVGGALIQMAGARTGGGNPSTSTIVYFPCMDCSVEESRVETAGGKVHKSKFSIGEYGFCAICLDTEGNTFGLYSMQ